MSDSTATADGAARRALALPRPGALAARLQASQAWILVLAVLLLVVVFEPDIVTAANGRSVLSSMAILGLLTLGQMVVLVGGGIDLSMAANVRLSTVLGATYMASPDASLGVGIAIVLGVSVAIGLVNGLLIGALGMPAFITTLGMLLLLDGATLTYKNTATGLAPEQLIDLYSKTVAGIPYPALALAVVALVTAAALTRTVWGRSVYAVGGDAALAEHAGIRVVRTRVSLYAVSGLLCGLASLVLLGRAGVGDPSALQGFELQSITAAVVGAVSLAGGRGTVWGALGGVAFLVAATTALSLVGVESRYLVLAQGLLILLALSSYRPRAVPGAAP